MSFRFKKIKKMLSYFRTRHHAMFEMLGNWSFGDYFKEEAIAWSWELLTEVYEIDKDKLYVTVFQGDEKENLLWDVVFLYFTTLLSVSK